MGLEAGGGGFQRDTDTPCPASKDARRKAGASDVARAASTPREVQGACESPGL